MPRRCKRRLTKRGPAPAWSASPASQGVLGTLADLVDIDDGCERGFEAAVEDALGTVVVDGTSAARDALRHLHDAGLHGGVLPTGRPVVADFF